VDKFIHAALVVVNRFNVLLNTLKVYFETIFQASILTGGWHKQNCKLLQ